MTAGVELFSRRGIANVTADEIAGRGKVRRGIRVVRSDLQRHRCHPAPRQRTISPGTFTQSGLAFFAARSQHRPQQPDWPNHGPGYLLCRSVVHRAPGQQTGQRRRPRLSEDRGGGFLGGRNSSSARQGFDRLRFHACERGSIRQSCRLSGAARAARAAPSTAPRHMDAKAGRRYPE